MRGHNICLYAELTKIIIKYTLLSRALKTKDSSFVAQCFHIFIKASDKNCAYVNILLQFSFGHHVTRPQGYKTCSMLNSVEHGILNAY